MSNRVHTDGSRVNSFGVACCVAKVHAVLTYIYVVMLAEMSNLVASYGYWGVALFILLESAGVPLPGETALIIASAYAGAGNLSIREVITFAAAAAIVGDAAGYWLGRKVGRDVLRFFRVKVKNVKRIEGFFKKHGPKTVFFGRFISILRTYSALFAGISHMSYPKFTAYNAAGGILWATAFGILGYTFGKNLHHLESVVHEINLVILIAIAVLILIFYGWRKLRVSHGTG